MRDAQENVVLDTVRGLTAGPVDDALLPTIPSLTVEGGEYKRAFTSTPWTLPSHASPLTGTFSSRHDTCSRTPVLDESLTTLSANGYETQANSNTFRSSDEFGLDSGFDGFQHAWRWNDADVAGRSPAKIDDGWPASFEQSLPEASTENSDRLHRPAREPRLPLKTVCSNYRPGERPTSVGGRDRSRRCHSSPLS